MGMLSPTIELFGVSCFFSSRFSVRRRFASTACLRRMRVLSIESGFSRKSYAPSLVARTAVSIVPWPEIIITSGGFSISRMWVRVSNPSILGNHTSSRTASKLCLRRTSRQASPLSAKVAEKPSSSRTPFNDSRIPDSSATMRMLGMLSDQRLGGFDCDWQFNNEARSNRTVFFHPYGTVMLFNDTTYDGQTEACAAFFSREIWKEEFFFEVLGDTGA